MLLQFTVENVLSFRDQAVFSLMAAPHVDHRPEHVVKLPGVSAPVLRVAALYGANASGKSNLVKALDLAVNLARGGVRAKEHLAIPSFALGPEPGPTSSRIEFELWYDSARWSYGFQIGGGRVESEWLFADSGSGERPVFQRDLQVFEFGTGVDLPPARRQFWDFVAEGTRSNQLFLAETAERNVFELAPAREALDHIVRSSAGFNPPQTPRMLAVFPEALEVAKCLVRDSGTGITDLDLHSDDAAVRKLVDEVRLATEQREEAKQELLSMSEEPELGLLFHRRSGQRTVIFPEASESDGTLRLVGLATAIYLLENHGRTFVIDELDRSLHTLVARMLVERFLEAPAHKSGQLIFTTHDTNLLDLNLLPRDSIWFVEKDAAGASSLYSLADFDAEQIEAMGPSLEQGYLAGRFGAIPFLGDAQRLGWLKKSAS